MTSPSSSSLAAAPPKARIPLILRRLGRTAERPVHARALDPLDSLILGVLSQNTTDVNSGRAFSQLRQRFPTWGEVVRARPQQIAAAIRSGGLAEIKSRRIKDILAQIEEDRGQLDLSFLRRLPMTKARDYLVGLSGIGRKTAAVVLLFALNKPAFPVDTHVLRVSKRLGLIPPNTTADRAHDIFDELLKGARGAMSDLHLGLVRHGRTVCIAGRPRCPLCVLFELCPRVGVTLTSQARRQR